MMEIQIPYNGKSVKVEFPDNTEILNGISREPLHEKTIRQKIKSGLEEFLAKSGGNKISVIVNDATRRIPTSRILKILLDQIPPKSLEILIATGTHRMSTDVEIDEILGDMRNSFGDRIFVHDCHDDSSMVELGRTGRGTRIIVNKKLAEAEAVICINSVEPHFFAGFTGGRKSLVPGMAAVETIVANHSHAKSEYAKSLNLENNPVHLDLEEAAVALAQAPIFSIQLVLSREGDIIDLHCGELKESFMRAVEEARRAYRIPIDKYYDIVFAIGEPPLDNNLYQLQKGQEHGAEAVADGGILIVIGACREGVGSPYFLRLADDYPTPRSALSRQALTDNRFGIHKLIKSARRLEKIKIWYVTNLDDNIIRKLYFEPKQSPQAAVRDALEDLGGSARVAILKDACFMVAVGV
jgi:nickel-dependent lactate racemase